MQSFNANGRYLVSPIIKENYRIFSRGNRIIFGERPKRAREKYSTVCIVPPRTEFLLGEGAPNEYHSVIRDAIAASVATDTKSGYSTALRMLKACQDSLGRSMSLPLSDGDILCFVAFMAKRDVLDTTISKYLSAIRYAMLSIGHQCENLRTPVVAQVLKGIRNLKRDPQVAVMKKTRRAMTIPHLKLLGHSLSTSALSPYTKGLVWGVAMLAFWGSTRVGELLGPLARAFDPKSAFLMSDVTFSVEKVRLWIRSPKCCTPTGDDIEVFAVPDITLDPVSAVSYFHRMRKEVHGEAKDLPFFIEEDGRYLTKQRFNLLLHDLLDHFLTDDRDSITGHSFRAGLATLMEAAGFSEDSIKAWGRWSSKAFKRYLKEKRPKSRIFSELYLHLSAR